MDDDGVRELDEATRPRVAGGVPLTEAQRAPGDHLRAIHDYFRAQLAAVVDAVEEVRRGEGSAGEVRAAVHGLAPRLAQQQLGAFCGQLCRFVTMHHSHEDHGLFPAVAAMPAYAAVAVRLADEHLVIHDHLVRVDAVVVRMATDPTLLPELEAAVAGMARVLESHFRYEEEELAEPLGLMGLPL